MFTYFDWAKAMRNHLIQSNHGYGRVLFEVERSNDPISLRNVGTAVIPGLEGSNWLGDVVGIHH